MQYYQVKVQFETDEGKKVTKQYLVDVQSVTESEARIVKHLTDAGEKAFDVVASSESKISEVIEQS